MFVLLIGKEASPSKLPLGESSPSLNAEPILKSPRNRRRTMLRLYHALGKANISVNLLISYLKEAEPISMIAREKKKRTMCMRLMD